jgi:hypothetical protein
MGHDRGGARGVHNHGGSCRDGGHAHGEDVCASRGAGGRVPCTSEDDDGERHHSEGRDGEHVVVR